jgi:hypothetical protein
MPVMKTRSLPALLVPFLACLVLLAGAAEAKPPRWEYLVVNAGLKNRPLEQMLNEQGKAGWELVAFTRNSVAVFKRPAN